MNSFPGPLQFVGSNDSFIPSIELGIQSVL